jgi:subfamily B ATP-binding cassette protein MsbA
VGRSGSGKSTLAGLITRQYEIPDNSIFLDGVDINQFKLANLRKHVSAVNQNIALFEDTVRNNVAYGDASYSDAQIKNALKCAHAQEFVDNLPDGLDTMIGENGLRLSGGQRQRVSLARAFLKNSPFLILDEATSALDNESESIVTRAIEDLAQTRTTLVIAHRLSTIKRADRLLVMDNGIIVESGTHKELLSKGGYYSTLYHTEYENNDKISAA